MMFGAQTQKPQSHFYQTFAILSTIFKSSEKGNDSILVRPKNIAQNPYFVTFNQAITLVRKLIEFHFLQQMNRLAKSAYFRTSGP